jgi:hypothetical protein
LRPLIFNPYRTEREYAEILNVYQTTAMHRDAATTVKTDQRIDAVTSAWRLKNPVGRVLHSLALPAFSKVIDQSWIAEDQRKLLIQKLNAPPES